MTSFPANISVYTGPCDRLDCFAFDVEQTACDSGVANGTAVSWLSSFMEGYSLLVHGYDDEIGNFQLNYSPIEPPNNDYCANAEPMELSGGRGAIIGSTYAVFVESNVQPCSVSSALGTRGVWYRIDESTLTPGSRLVASTCLPATDFSAAVSVYTGTCDELVCVATADELSICGESRSAEWRSAPGDSYYILVHGSGEWETGRFGLSVVVEFQQPPNDECIQAAEVGIGQVMQGSTDYAGKDDAPLCIIPVQAPGVWYRVTPENATGLRADLSSDYAGAVSIYSETCRDLACVTGSSDSVYWAAKAGVTYYILVHGQNQDIAGSFELTLSAFDIEPNDLCINAIELEVDGSFALGSTFSATKNEDLPLCDYPIQAPG